MRRALLVLLVLVLAGCAKPKVTPSDHFLFDGPDEDAEGFADLLWADFRELNGSVVLEMEYRNMSGRIPEFTATFDIRTEAETQTWFLRSQANFSKPPTNLEYVVGRVEDQQYVVVEQVCGLAEVTRGPWIVRVEAEHRVTGLTQTGATIRGLGIQTGDFEGKAIDFAETSGSFDLRGGTNPHDQCPLHAERPE